MLDIQRIFHTGFLVPNLADAMHLYGTSLNLEWAAPFTFEELDFWTPERGAHKLRLEVTYSTQGPLHIELLAGSEGSFYDPSLHDGLHTGYWSDDVTGDANALISQGWEVQAAGAGPEEGWGAMVYLRPPGGGPMYELATTALMPVFEDWWAGRGTLG